MSTQKIACLAVIAGILFLTSGLGQALGETDENFRSIGTYRGTLYGRGTVTIEAGRTIATFEGAKLPEYVGKGDQLKIGKEKLYILNILKNNQVEVQKPAAKNHVNRRYRIRRAFASIQAWENARDGDLVGQNRREIGICYNDGPFRRLKSKALVTIDGSNTDSEHFMWLTAAEFDRHNGLDRTGVVLDGSNVNKYGIRIRDDYTRVQGLELKRFRHGKGSAAVHVRRAQHVFLGQLIIHKFNSRGFEAVGIKGSKDSDFTAQNCIIYNGGAAAIQTTRWGSSATIRNCTIYGMRGYGVYEDRGVYSVTNTISMNNRLGDFHVFRGEQDFNISSDDTAAGQNSMVGLNPADNFVSVVKHQEDFHLKEGSDAIDAGMMASISYSAFRKIDHSSAESVDIDIDGSERPAGKTWDIGADEYESIVVEEETPSDPPVIIEEAPVIIEEAPVAIEEAPVVIEEAPVANEEAPVVIEEAPVIIEEAPLFIEEAPVIIEEAPVVIEEAPVIIEEAPVVIEELA
ncbi:MAG: right-handed parallel beta-helix repeat-containing protein [Desulfobacterales bacterium]|jgi:hypothetical protein